MVGTGRTEENVGPFSLFPFQALPSGNGSGGCATCLFAAGWGVGGGRGRLILLFLSYPLTPAHSNQTSHVLAAVLSLPPLTAVTLPDKRLGGGESAICFVASRWRERWSDCHPSRCLMGGGAEKVKGPFSRLWINSIHG